MSVELLAMVAVLPILVALILMVGMRWPATKAMPKEMLPVVDKPLIQYAVASLSGG